MDFVFFLSFWIFGFMALVYAARKENKGRRLRAGLTVFVPVMLVFTFDEIIGQAYMYAWCGWDNRLRVNEKLQGDGYFNISDHTGCNSDCLDALLKRKFKYYEVDVQGNYSIDTTERGIHQFYLIDIKSGHCTDGSTDEIPNPRYSKKDLMPEGKCVGYKILANPESRYEVSMNNKSPVWPFSKGHSIVWPYPARLYKEYSYVKDRKSGAVVASYARIWWWGGWLRNNSFGNNSATVCPAIGSVMVDVRDSITANTK